jgi:nucleoside 2-deoxyribosyltransferase
MKIYLAGQITGKSYQEVVDYFIGTKQVLEIIGYTVFHPMTGKGELRNETEFTANPSEYCLPVATNHAIFERDKWMIENSDIILMNLEMDKVSIGCMFELAWGNILGKHTVVIMSKGNHHDHAFVHEGADVIFPTVEEALDYLVDLVEGST